MEKTGHTLLSLHEPLTPSPLQVPGGGGLCPHSPPPGRGPGAGAGSGREELADHGRCSRFYVLVLGSRSQAPERLGPTVY